MYVLLESKRTLTSGHIVCLNQSHITRHWESLSTELNTEEGFSKRITVAPTMLKKLRCSSRSHFSSQFDMQFPSFVYPVNGSHSTQALCMSSNQATYLSPSPYMRKSLIFFWTLKNGKSTTMAKIPQLAGRINYEINSAKTSGGWACRHNGENFQFIFIVIAV